MKAFGNNIILTKIENKKYKEDSLEDEKYLEGVGIVKFVGSGVEDKLIQKDKKIYFQKHLQNEVKDYWVIEEKNILAYD
jgi:hypothetical protein